MKNLRISTGNAYVGIIAFCLIFWASVFGCFAQTWQNVGNGLQQKVVAGDTSYRFVKTPGSGLPFAITAQLNKKVDTVLLNQLIGYITPQKFGAKGDGVNDDTEAVRMALASSLNVKLFGSYKITDSLVIRDNQKVYSDNAIISFITSNKPALVANDADFWSISGKLKIIGSGISNNTAVGLKLIKCNSYSVSGLTVKKISGDGILLFPKVPASPTIAGGNFIDCTLDSNWTGFRAISGDIGNAGAEYATITNINAYGNNTAFEIGSGNVSIVGGSIKYNGNGIILGEGGNNSHGIISGVNINHNTINNVWANGATYGETFVGCHLYGSDTAGIRIENSRSMLFIGCIIDGVAIVDTVDGHFIKSTMLDVDFVVDNPSGTLKITDCFTRYGNSYSGNLADDRYLLKSGTALYSGQTVYPVTLNGNTNELLYHNSNTAFKSWLGISDVAPSSSTDTGNTGDIRITSGFFYYCPAPNTWVRTALTTW